MLLRALAGSVPAHSLTQAECWEYFQRSRSAQRLRPRSVELVHKVLHGPSGIERRHFALAELDQLFDLDAEQLNRAFERHAPALAGEALLKALEQAELRAEDLDALVVCTCTGYLCPGISSYVAENLQLRPDAYLQDLVGLGCGAAIPALRSADALIARHPESRVAVVAVEVCSAAFYLDDDPGVIISACLFGDGASASIWTAGDGPGWHFGDSDTLHLPADRDLLRFENAGGKLRNRLHISVPRKASQVVHQLYQRYLARQPVVIGAGPEEGPAGEPDQIIAHAGGRDVLVELEDVLRNYYLAESREVLRRYGNLSSPSVLFALEQRLAQPQPGRCLWLTSFGAGFSAHSCALRWSDTAPTVGP